MAGVPAASRMPLVISTRYEVSCLSGVVGTIASVRPVLSLGASAVTNSPGAVSSRVTPVTPPPGPVRVTSNMRTVWPGTIDAAAGGALNAV